jgi:hypothetical protein
MARDFAREYDRLMQATMQWSWFDPKSSESEPEEKLLLY